MVQGSVHLTPRLRAPRSTRAADEKIRRASGKGMKKRVVRRAQRTTQSHLGWPAKPEPNDLPGDDNKVIRLQRVAALPLSAR